MHITSHTHEILKEDFRKKSFWLCFLRKVDTAMVSSEHGSSNGAALAFDNQSFQTLLLGNRILEKQVDSQWGLTAHTVKVL